MNWLVLALVMYFCIQLVSLALVFLCIRLVELNWLVVALVCRMMMILVSMRFVLVAKCHFGKNHAICKMSMFRFNSSWQFSFCSIKFFNLFQVIILSYYVGRAFPYSYHGTRWMIYCWLILLLLKCRLSNVDWA